MKIPDCERENGAHEDPDNSGQCIHCGKTAEELWREMDAFDEAYARALARSDDHDHWS